MAQKISEGSLCRRAISFQRGCGDLRGATLQHQPRRARDRTIQIFESASRHHAFRREMIKPLAQIGDNRIFAGVWPPSLRGPAACDHVIPFENPNKACHTKSGSWSKYSHWRIRTQPDHRHRIQIGRGLVTVSGGRFKIIEQTDFRAK